MHGSGTRLRPAVPSALPFQSGEYRSRQVAVRGALSDRGLDLLFVTSPENLCYLTGYEALWYPPRLPVGAVLAADDSELLLFDWSRHAGYVGTRVLCDECVLIDYADASTQIARVLAARGGQRAVIGLEWGSPSPAAPVMTSLANALHAAGAMVSSGDQIVDQIRLYKSRAEQQRIRRAAAIADEALLELQRQLRPGLTELEISTLLMSLLVSRGSELAAMPPQVNSGPTAFADTHSFPSRRRIEAGDVVSIDCCAVVDRYHANLGRTFAVGTINQRAASLLEHASDSILELQRSARRGQGTEHALAAALRHVRGRIAADNIWWVGGYSLGIAFPPSWVGHAYLANEAAEQLFWQPGLVSNYENIFIDQTEGFEAAYIDTVMMTEDGVEILSGMPRTLLSGGQ